MIGAPSHWGARPIDCIKAPFTSKVAFKEILRWQNDFSNYVNSNISNAKCNYIQGNKP